MNSYIKEENNIICKNGKKDDNIHEINRELIKQYKKNNDSRAKNELILNNINLVRKVAFKKSKMSSLNYEDLIQEGILGLIKGIEKFDVSRNTELSTYVYYWIVQSIDRAIYDRGFLVRLPVHITEKINKINKIEKFHMIKYGEVNVDELCEALDISVQEYNEMKSYDQKVRKVSSLNQSALSEESNIDESELLQIIPVTAKINFNYDEENMDVEDMVFSHLLKDDIEKALHTLTPREENIIRERFGLYHKEPKTLGEIGKFYNVTRERIRQIEAKAIRKLRHPSRAKRLRDYLIRAQ